MLDKELLNNINLEIEAALNSNDDYIMVIDRMLEKNLLAIYNAVTEIELKNTESYKKVKRLVEKQEYYKKLKKNYLNEKIRVTSVKL
jgi:hypothetical protein